MLFPLALVLLPFGICLSRSPPPQPPSCLVPTEMDTVKQDHGIFTLEWSRNMSPPKEVREAMALLCLYASAGGEQQMSTLQYKGSTPGISYVSSTRAFTQLTDHAVPEAVWELESSSTVLLNFHLHGGALDSEFGELHPSQEEKDKVRIYNNQGYKSLIWKTEPADCLLAFNTTILDHVIDKPSSGWARYEEVEASICRPAPAQMEFHRARPILYPNQSDFPSSLLRSGALDAVEFILRTSEAYKTAHCTFKLAMTASNHADSTTFVWKCTTFQRAAPNQTFPMMSAEEHTVHYEHDSIIKQIQLFRHQNSFIPQMKYSTVNGNSRHTTSNITPTAVTYASDIWAAVKDGSSPRPAFKVALLRKDHRHSGDVPEAAVRNFIHSSNPGKAGQEILLRPSTGSSAGAPISQFVPRARLLPLDYWGEQVLPTLRHGHSREDVDYQEAIARSLGGQGRRDTGESSRIPVQREEEKAEQMWIQYENRCKKAADNLRAHQIQQWLK